MNTNSNPLTTWDHLWNPVAACFTPEVARKIADLPPSHVILARLNILRQRANQGTLSNSERAEYEEYVEALDWMALFKAKVKQLHPDAAS